MAAATATGVPNPAAPSTNAPKAKAISSACRRGSSVRLADGILEDFELAALQRDAIEQDRGEDHPADGEQAERRAVGDGADQLPGGHAVDAAGHQHGGGQPGQRGDPRRLAQHAEQHQQGENRDRGHQRRKRQAAGDRCIVLLPHRLAYPWTRRSLPRPEGFAQLALDDFAGAGLGQRVVRRTRSAAAS